jgi:hypothetical protein
MRTWARRSWTGAFESGVVAKYFGPVGSVVAGGIGCLLVVLSVMAPVPLEPAPIGQARRSN